MGQTLVRVAALIGVPAVVLCAAAITFEPEGEPFIVPEDRPRLARALGPGTEDLDVLFIYDGSGSIDAEEFDFEKAAIKECIQGLPIDGTAAVALIQFSSMVVLDLPLTLIDSQAALDDLLLFIDGIVQIGGGTNLAPPLDLAFDIMANEAVGSTRQVFVFTDAAVTDAPAAEARCEDLRTMPVPVRICTALVGFECPLDNIILMNCANTIDSVTFNPDQPEGFYLCTNFADCELPVLCEQCLNPIPAGAVVLGFDDCDGDGIPDLCESDCNLNNVLDDCEESPGFCVANEHAKLHASDAEANDRFGFAVAIDGPVIVVGAHLNDDAGSSSGAAYVFRFDGTNWIEQAKLTASDAVAGDNFGKAVAVSGDVVLIGAPRRDLPGPDAGAAYVFQRNQGGPDNWGQVAQLLSTDLAAGDDFGSAVALSCNHALVGAPGNDDQAFDSGSAYVFKRNQGGQDNWGQVVKLIPSGGATLDEFGTSVSLEGDVGIVGAPGNEIAGSNPGTAYVFRRTMIAPEIWVEITQLTAEASTGVDDDFGSSVSISGDLCLVGASLTQSCGPTAFAFGFVGDRWTPLQRLIVGSILEDDEFAVSVAVDGDMAIVSAHRDAGAGLATGVAYVYRFDGDLWIQNAKLAASDPFPIDEFSSAVALSCGTAVIGARGDDDNGSINSGSAYIITGVSDCNLNGEADVCDIALGTSEDLDLDGAPDECSFCPGTGIRISQESAPGLGDFDSNVLGCLAPYSTTVAASHFYGYNPVTTSHDGAFFCPVADRSQLLLAQTGSGLTLVVVHDGESPADPDGGRAEMVFTLSGDADGSFFGAHDDPAGVDGYTGNPGDSVFTTVHSWPACCTDGMALGDLEGEWSMIIQFVEIDGNPGTPPIAGLSEWVALSACGAEIPLVLQANLRVRLDQPPTCDADLDGDSIVGITDFLALLAAWDTSPGGPPDLDGDGIVGIVDFLLLLGAWGSCF